MFNRNKLPDEAFCIVKDEHKLLRHHNENVKDANDNESAIPYLIDFGLNNIEYLPISDDEKKSARDHLEMHKNSFEKQNKGDKEEKSENKTNEEVADVPNDDDLIAEDLAEGAVWTTAFVNNLPDSSFAVVEKGGKKDEGGKTVPRNYRHLPYKDASGKVDLPHLRNALARMNQIKAISSKDNTERIRAVARRALIAAAKKHLPGSKFTEGELLGAEAKIINIEQVGEMRYIDVMIQVSSDGPQFSIPFDVKYDKDGNVQYVKMYHELIPGDMLPDIAKFLNSLSK